MGSFLLQLKDGILPCLRDSHPSKDATSTPVEALLRLPSGRICITVEGRHQAEEREEVQGVVLSSM